MKFSELMARLALADGAHRVEVGDDWLQGRSLFGGLQAALALAAMQAQLDAPLPLRTLQVTFLAPVPAGVVTVQARRLRAGKSAVHCEARLGPADAPQAIAVGIFGAGRPSAVAVAPPAPPPPAGPGIDFRYVEGLTPRFTRHFPMTWRRGALPYTGSRETAATIEVTIDDAGPATEAHVLAIADAIPPLGLSMLRTPAPGSSMTWTLELLRHDFAAQPLDRWRLEVELVAAGEGYTSQSAIVFDPRGAAIALSRQNMVIFG